MKTRSLSALMILVAMSLALAACSAAAPAAPTAQPIPVVKADSAIIAEGRVEPTRYAKLALNANGLVGDVLVKEGEPVTPGQVIARIENSQAKTLETAQADAAAALTAAYQAVRDAQYDLDEYDVPSDFSGMTPGQAVEDRLAKLNAARDAFEPYKYLSDKRLNVSPVQQYNQNNQVYRDVARERKKALDDSWAKYRKAVQWLNLATTLESAQSQLSQAQKDYDILQDTTFAESSAGARAALANAELRSPFAGTITNLDLKAGEFAASGTPAVTVADFSAWVVKTTDLTEIDVVNIKEGQGVDVTLDAIPDVKLKGYVLSIGQNYSEKQGDVVYEVTVLLTDKHPAMRWGMTAEVHFAE